jgi:hypothetical protein
VSINLSARSHCWLPLDIGAAPNKDKVVLVAEVSFKNCLFNDTGLNDGFLEAGLRSIFDGDVLSDLSTSLTISLCRVRSLVSGFSRVPSDEADSGDSDDPLLLLILSIDFVVVTIVLVGSEVFVIRIFPPEVVEVLRDLFASTPVVERSTTDRARGLSTLLLVCESAITILGSIQTIWT